MDDTERRIRIACIDVFDDPDDAAARSALTALLPTAREPESRDLSTARIRSACQDLYDDPHDRAAQLQVLELL